MYINFHFQVLHKVFIFLEGVLMNEMDVHVFLFKS